MHAETTSIYPYYRDLHPKPASEPRVLQASVVPCFNNHADKNGTSQPLALENRENIYQAPSTHCVGDWGH